MCVPLTCATEDKGDFVEQCFPPTLANIASVLLVPFPAYTNASFTLTTF